MMKSLLVAISLSVVAYASPGFAGPLSQFAASSDQDAGRFVISSTGKSRFVYRNANSCAPNRGVPVWSRGPTPGKLLGYRCYDISNAN
jgi:hypothetical protein